MWKREHVYQGSYCCDEVILCSSIRNLCPSTREPTDGEDILWLINVRDVADRRSSWERILLKICEHSFIELQG